tara:strand:+ start:2285 stop:2923 length:639 start_codon:yes stop_codon:yes gene_type:complete
MASKTATSKQVVEVVANIKKALTEHAFSNPREKAMEVMEKLKHLQQKYKGKRIALRFQTRRVEFLHHETQICVDYMEEVTQEEEFDRRIMTTEKETERFHKAVKYAKKEKEEIFFVSVVLNEYRHANWEEFLQQVDQWVERLDDVELLEDNIRSWKWGEQKYYRLTFTSANMTKTSSTEFAFGRLVQGLTYVVKKEHFKKHKTTLYEKLSKK